MGATKSNEIKRGSRRKNGISEFSGGWQGFVDIRLTPDEKASLSAMGASDYPDIGAFIDDVLSDGYKFSVTRDEAHSCYISTITGKGQGCVNAGFSLSARGPSLDGSILTLYYKHVVICDRLIWAGHERVEGQQLSLWD